MVKHILFITTSNLPTNPRLLKEIDLISKDNSVTVLLFKLGNWSDSTNQNMMDERLHIQFIELDVTRKKRLHWFLWAIIEKLARVILPLFKKSLVINALSHGRRSIMLWTKLTELKTKPNYIVAHNLGALYPAFALSKKYEVPFIYDIEDYDPGIVVRNGGRHYVSICEQLMKSCLPSSIALTSASPLIGEYTLKLIGGHPNHQVILNSFPSDEFQPPSEKDSDILKLVWFSQKISFGRGIEQLIEAFKLLIKHQYGNYEKDLPISLTLIGDIDSRFHKQILQPALKSVSAIKIEILPPMNQSELHRNLANYDVGLALEFNNTDLNRQLCLTNKILAYTQAGLYILATGTPAQKAFMQENGDRGIICGQTEEEICKSIVSLIEDISFIKKNATTRYNHANNLSWEKEALKLKSLYNLLLSK